MKYSWVLFDADDTLFDFSRSARHALQRTLHLNDISPQANHWDLYKTINDQAWKAFENGEITAIELRRIRFERFLSAIGEYRDPLEMNRLYLAELSNTWFLVDGAIQVLQTLWEEKISIGLITNGLKEVQRARITKASLEVYFRVIVVSDEIGIAKPHAGFFEHTFSAMGNPRKQEVLIVGDSLHSDIRGGNDFGVDTCWFNPGGQSNLSTHRPSFQIVHLTELEKILLK